MLLSSYLEIGINFTMIMNLLQVYIISTICNNQSPVPVQAVA